MPKRSRYEDSRSHGDKRYRPDGPDRWRRQEHQPPQHERSYSTPGNFNQRAWSGPRPIFPPPTQTPYDYRRPNWAPRPWQGGYGGPHQPGNYVNAHDPTAQQHWDWRPVNPEQPGTSNKRRPPGVASNVTDDGEDVIEIIDDVITLSDDVDEEDVALKEKVTTPAAVQGYSQHAGRSGHQSYYAQDGEEAEEGGEGFVEEEKEDRTQAYSQAHRHRQAGQSHGGKFPSKFQLEAAARDIINKLANDSQNLVSSHLIEKALLKYFQVKDLRDLGIKFLDEINFVHDLLKLQGRVSSYIQAYCSMATISSYYDLKECLQEFTPESGNFLDLNLGPLSKQPLVYKYFKIPANYKLPKITGSQVWMHLKDFMTDRDLWTGQVDLTEFITYLQKQYNVPSPLHLGIRVQSLPLAIQMLKKAQKDQGKNLRTAFMQYKMELANDVARAFQNFKAEVLEKTDKGWEVKKFYCQASVPQVTGSIFNKLQILFNAVLYQNDGKWKALKNVSDVVAAFSSRLAEDRLLASLFQLAVSVSSHDFQENLVKKIFPNMGGKSSKNTTDDSETPSEKKKVKPNSADLLSKLDKYVQRCLTHGQLTLEQMAKIEQKIVENYETEHFGQLGYGNFLTYIAETKDVAELLEELGVNLSGGVGSGGGSGTAYHPGLTDLLDLVQQCRLDPTLEAQHIESALCSHYNVQSVKVLGYGPIKSVLIAHERHQKKRHGEQHAVLYESAVCANSTLVKSARLDAEGQGQVGRLGHQTREVALSCLQSCPLLDNLADWSQWPLVFESELGPLKQFVLKHGGCYTVQLQGVGNYQTDIVAMETEPGVLLKLTSQTSVDNYVTALEGDDVTAICGHLISIVVQSQGLRNAPISLLANHTLQYMMNLQNKELDKDKEGRVNAESRVVTFVGECLVVLPLKLCHLLADKVLLEPLSQVVGSTRSKVLLMESARSAAYRNRLHSLGILLGVSEWRDHYQKQVKQGHDAIVKRSREETKLLEALVPKDIADDGGSESESSDDDDDDDDNDESFKAEQNLADNFLDSDEEEVVSMADDKGE